MSPAWCLRKAIYPLWPCDAIWWHRSVNIVSGNGLVPFILTDVDLSSDKGNFKKDAPSINHWNWFENYSSKIQFKSHRSQWVKHNRSLTHSLTQSINRSINQSINYKPWIVHILQDIVHCKPRVVMIPTLSSLVALKVVVMTIYATSDDNVGIMANLSFQWICWHSFFACLFLGTITGEKQWVEADRRSAAHYNNGTRIQYGSII